MDMSVFDAIGQQIKAVADVAARWRQHISDDNDFAIHRKLRIISFPICWSSTACGFGGLGGAAMTWAQTTVLYSGSVFFIYHVGRFAYMIVEPTQKFFEDLCNRKLCGIKDKELQDYGNNIVIASV